MSTHTLPPSARTTREPSVRTSARITLKHPLKDAVLEGFDETLTHDGVVSFFWKNPLINGREPEPSFNTRRVAYPIGLIQSAGIILSYDGPGQGQPLPTASKVTITFLTGSTLEMSGFSETNFEDAMSTFNWTDDYGRYVRSISFPTATIAAVDIDTQLRPSGR